jgi:hypothetical protein
MNGAMVSLTDHDNISAPDAAEDCSQRAAHSGFSRVERALRRHAVDFHLGVHNLPSDRATEWMDTLAEYTANPNDARLSEILAALNGTECASDLQSSPCGIFT